MVEKDCLSDKEAVLLTFEFLWWHSQQKQPDGRKVLVVWLWCSLVWLWCSLVCLSGFGVHLFVCLVLVFTCLFVLPCSIRQPEILSIIQTSLEPVCFLSQPPKCWDGRLVHCLASGCVYKASHWSRKAGLAKAFLLLLLGLEAGLLLLLLGFEFSSTLSTPPLLFPVFLEIHRP